MSEAPTDFIAEAITEAFGERCPEFADGCACCEAWKQYDDLSTPIAAGSAEATEEARVWKTEEEILKILDDNPNLRQAVDSAIDAIDFDLDPMDIAEHWLKQAMLAQGELTALRAALSAAEAAEPVAWRYRHSEQENWHYGPDRQNWWECQPLFTSEKRS